MDPDVAASPIDFCPKQRTHATKARESRRQELNVGNFFLRRAKVYVYTSNLLEVLEEHNLTVENSTWSNDSSYLVLVVILYTHKLH